MSLIFYNDTFKTVLYFSQLHLNQLFTGSLQSWGSHFFLLVFQTQSKHDTIFFPPIEFSCEIYTYLCLLCIGLFLYLCIYGVCLCAQVCLPIHLWAFENQRIWLTSFIALHNVFLRRVNHSTKRPLIS